MAKQFAIIRVEKHKKGSVSAVNNHNFRNGNIESNIKTEKTKDNILLFGTDNIKNDINSYIETSGIKPRNKDTVLFQEFVLTASPEFFFNNKDGSKKTKEQYEKNLKDWIKTQVDYLKKENYGICVNAVVHLDESTPHIHAVVLPIKDGKFNCKAFYRGKNSYSKLLDQYAVQNKKHGLIRGEEQSLADHKTLKDFRNLAQKHMQDLEIKQRNIASRNSDLVKKETNFLGLEKKFTYDETKRLIKESNKKTLNAYSFYKHNYKTQYTVNIGLEKQNSQQKKEIDLLNEKQKKLNKEIRDLNFQLKKINQLEVERDFYYEVAKEAKEALSDILKHPFKSIKDLKNFFDFRKNSLKTTTYKETEQEKNTNKNNELEEKSLSRAVDSKILDKDTLQQKLTQNEPKQPEDETKPKPFKM